MDFSFDKYVVSVFPTSLFINFGLKSILSEIKTAKPVYLGYFFPTIFPEVMSILNVEVSTLCMAEIVHSIA